MENASHDDFFAKQDDLALRMNGDEDEVMICHGNAGLTIDDNTSDANSALDFGDIAIIPGADVTAG